MSPIGGWLTAEEIAIIRRDHLDCAHDLSCPVFTLLIYIDELERALARRDKREAML